MTSKLSIFLLENENRTKNDIAAVLKSHDIGYAGLTDEADFQTGIRLMQNDEPHIVFLEVKEVEEGVNRTEFLVSRFPDVPVVVIAAEKDPDWILRLIRAGATEYLTKPIVAADLAVAIHKVARSLDTRKIQPAREIGTVISVYNPAGGMGTTSVAVNLAASLAAQGKDVALVDLNLCCGDVTTFLDLTPRYNLSSVIARRGNVDASFIKSVLVQHPSGVRVLSGPANLEDAAAIQPEQILQVITILKGLFPYVVIDTGGQLYGCNLAAMQASHKILFTTILILHALKNAKRYLTAMNLEGLGPEKVKLVINRHIPKDDIKVADAEKVLNTKTYATLPNAYSDVKTSINRGVPLATSSPRAAITKAFDDLARQVSSDSQRI